MAIREKKGRTDAQNPLCRFEIFVSKGFCSFEVSAIVHTLMLANKVCGREAYTWRIVSEDPGYVASMGEIILRAEPCVHDHAVHDVLCVVGGETAAEKTWMQRTRMMQRIGRVAVLFSDAATAYIRATRNPPGKVTTHWRDVDLLEETGSFPNLTGNLSENSAGIITAAGHGATAELIIGLISRDLTGQQIAELGCLLVLPTIRKTDAEQPRSISDNEALFDSRVTQAVRLMESQIAEPYTIAELTESLDVSARHLERIFRAAFDLTPGKFYKRLRTKRARRMIEETNMALLDVAVATGFSSTGTLAIAVREEYGVTPTQMRSRRQIKLLKFDAQPDHRLPN